MMDILLLLDPIENYVGTIFEGLDALEREARRMGISTECEESVDESTSKETPKISQQV